jgi:hypothetical protein
VNEVTNAREWSSTDLMVVDQIRLETDPNGLITTSGGRVRRWENWAPAEDSLFAVVLSHFLSVGGQTEWAADLIRHYDISAAPTGEGVGER